jgi:PAS domain S-box-containing protein
MRSVMSKKFTLSFAIAGLSVLANAVISYHNTNQLIKNEERVVQTVQVLEQLESTLSTLKDAETGQRGYILTGDEAYLQPYQDAITRLDRQLASLKPLTADHPEQQRRLAILEQQARNRLKIIRQTITLRQTQGLEAAQQVVVLGEGKKVMDQIRQLVADMEKTEETLLKQQARESQLSVQKISITLMLASIFGIGLLIALYLLVRRDLAARQQAADTLQEREHHLQAILDAEPECVKVVAADGTVLQMNPAGLAMIEAPDATSVLGHSVYPLIVPEHRAAVTRDITQRKQTEAELNRLNRTLKTLLDCNQVLVRASDESDLLQNICRIIVDVGSYRLAWIGFAEHDAAKTIRPVVWAGHETGYLQQLQLTWAETEQGQGPTGTAIRTGQPCIVQNILTEPRYAPWQQAAKQRGYAASIALPLLADHPHPFGALNLYAAEPDAFDPAEIRLLVELAGDVAFALRHRRDRLLAETALHTSEERLRLALDAAQMGTWDWNMGTTPIIWSEEHERLFGFAPGTFDGTFATFCACLHPDDRDSVIQTESRARAEKRNYHHEYRVIWADGSIHWIESRGHAIYDPAGQPARLVGTVMAIDDRKRAEAALQESEIKYRTLFNTIDQGFVLCDVIFDERDRPFDVFYVDANAAAVRMTGQELKGRRTSDLSPDFELEWFATLGRVARTGHAIRSELPATPLNAWYEFYAFRPDDANPQRVALIYTDITERRRAEVALQEQESLLRLFIQYAPAGIAMFDRKMRYVMASQQWIDEYQLESIEAVIRRSHYEIFPEIPDHWRQIHQRCLAGAIEKCNEDLFVRADGNQQWISWEIRPWYAATGEIGGIIVFSVDVTQRKQAEVALQAEKRNLEIRVAERTAELLQANQHLQQELEQRQKIQAALQTSQAQFAGILNIAEDAIISIDAQQRITLFNQGAEKIFGYMAPEIIGQSLDVLIPLRFIQAHRQHVTDFKGSSVQARRMGERREIYGRRKDGSEFPAEASISKLNVDHETIFTVFLQDITERKQIDRMKSEFISVVSHELRTPLTSIHGSLGILASGLLKPDSDQGKRMLQIAVDSTDRLVRLINDILDIERIESDRVKMEKECCQVEDLIHEAINVVQPLANKAGVTLSVTSLPIQVWADPDRIVQTLTNLLSNAIKFSTAGRTVWLTVEESNREPSHPAIPSSAHPPVPPCSLLFTIQDHGRGIPADKLDSIFERFQQVDSSDSRNHEGTGLGLAICRSIVQQHDGHIWVESVLGKGSTFYFTLKLKPLNAEL